MDGFEFARFIACSRELGRLGSKPADFRIKRNSNHRSHVSASGQQQQQMPVDTRHRGPEDYIYRSRSNVLLTSGQYNRAATIHISTSLILLRHGSGQGDALQVVTERNAVTKSKCRKSKLGSATVRKKKGVDPCWTSQDFFCMPPGLTSDFVFHVRMRPRVSHNTRKGLVITK